MKTCYLCHKNNAVHLHHVYGGAYRKKSDKLGLVVTLCLECHTGRYGVHLNNELNCKLKGEIQRKFMLENGIAVEEFIKMFGRSYI